MSDTKTPREFSKELELAQAMETATGAFLSLMRMKHASDLTEDSRLQTDTLINLFVTRLAHEFSPYQMELISAKLH